MQINHKQLLILAIVVALGFTGVVADYFVGISVNGSSEFTGSAKCAECHKSQFDRWHASPHDRAMDLATSETVLGDFNNAHLNYQGMTSRMFRDGERYMIHTEGPDGELADFEVKYVFGFDPSQRHAFNFFKAHRSELPHRSELLGFQIRRPWHPSEIELLNG